MNYNKVTVDKWGTKCWRIGNGRFHRLGGPAIEYPDGESYWYIDGFFLTAEEHRARVNLIRMSDE